MKQTDPLKILSPTAIQAEFELATTGMTFEGEDGKAMRQLFYTYFVAGVLWAQGELVPEGVWVARTQEELALATQELLTEQELINETNINKH